MFESSMADQIRDKRLITVEQRLQRQIKDLDKRLRLVLTSDSPPEDPARRSEVVRSPRGIGVHPLAQESQILHC